jgi:hypothetical protein
LSSKVAKGTASATKASGGAFYRTASALALFSREKGMGAQPVPVDKKFAPSFATQHSLLANAVSLKSEEKVKSAERHINQKLAPQRERIIKDYNALVDLQLKVVVDKINVKQELEKKQRELIDKRQKRQDEVQSLILQS